MAEIWIGLFVGLIFFVSTITAYSFGIKHGRVVKNDGVPNINPVKAIDNIRESKENKVTMDTFTQGLQNILSYGDKG